MPDPRILAGSAHNEDAAVLSLPPGQAIVQSVDVLAPVVNDAYAFGRIAACNALSDIYAMGGSPWCAMSLAFFPPCLLDSPVLTDILQGSLDAVSEAGAVSAGGHTVQDEELKYGLSVTGVINPKRIARNDGLKPGLKLVLTKPLGIGILATALKANWDHAAESEQAIIHWAGQLNKAGGELIGQLGLPAATDITGFGLGGHAIEMAIASDAAVEIYADRLPLLPYVIDYAQNGLIPAGTHANIKHFLPQTHIESGVDEDQLSVIFDAQTSGGLLLAIPPEKLSEACEFLEQNAALAVEIGQVLEKRPQGKYLLLKKG